MRLNSPIHHRFRRPKDWEMGIGSFLIVLGMVAIVFSLTATVSASFLFGWLFLLAGVVQAAYAVQSRPEKYYTWELLLGILYIQSGIFVAASSVITVLTLTIIVGISIFSQSLIQTVGAFDMRPEPGWAWLLFGGIVGSVLSVLIMAQWPSGTVWSLGIWFGINLLCDGLGLLMGYSRRHLP